MWNVYWHWMAVWLLWLFTSFPYLGHASELCRPRPGPRSSGGCT